MTHQTYLTTPALLARNQYDVHRIRDRLQDAVLRRGCAPSGPAGTGRSWMCGRPSRGTWVRTPPPVAACCRWPTATSAMTNLRGQRETGILFFNLPFTGVRSRKQTVRADTPPHRKQMAKVRERLLAKIARRYCNYHYRDHFANSALAGRCAALGDAPVSGASGTLPRMGQCAEICFTARDAEWRLNNRDASGLRGQVSEAAVQAFVERVESLQGDPRGHLPQEHLPKVVSSLK